MDERDKEILRQNRTFIVSNMHDTHNICEDLYVNDILTESMRSEIMAESTLTKQNRKLLDILPKRGNKAFQSFLEALRNNSHEQLATKLDPSFVKLSSISISSHPNLVLQESTKQHSADETSKSLANENQSVTGEIGKDPGFQDVHGPKGVQPQDLGPKGVQPQDVGPKGVCRQESSSQPPSIKDFVEKFEMGVGSKDFSITPVDDKMPRNLPLSQKYYTMPKRRLRGRVCIINNTSFRNKLPEREHQYSSVDSSRLIKMFNDLEFKVLPLIRDLDLKTTKENLETEAKFDHSKYDCFILVIISYGKGSSIYTADGELISIQEITEIFSDTGAPSLKGKPKIFIFQAAEYNASMNRHDSASFDVMDRLADLKLVSSENTDVTDTKQDVLDKPCSPDMFVVLGTAGYSTTHGSYFIQVLANYICTLVYECHLEDIIKKVNSIDVADKDNELCTYKSSLTKDFYFFTSL